MGRLVRISDAKGPRSFGTGPRTEKQEPQVKPTPALPKDDLTGLAYEALRSGTLPMTTPAGRVAVPTGAAAQRASMLRDYAQLADDQKRDRLEGELYQLTQPGRVYNQETTQRNRARAAEIQGELDGLLPRESGRFKSGVQSILSAGLGAVPTIAATAKSLDWSIGEERNRAESRQLAELDRKIRALEGSRRGDALDHIRGTDEWKALDAQRRALSLQANPAVDMDDPGMRLMRESNQYREQALEGLEGVPRFLGGTALSIGQNAALLPLAAVNPALPLAAMGTISAADRMYELGERGLPASEALSRGLISGGIEAATEKIPLDTLLDAMKTGGKGALRNILHQAGTEAGEESVSYLANYLVDKAYKDPEAEFSLAELAQAAAGGALSGGVFGGFGSAYNAVGERLNRPVEMGTEETDPSAFGLRMTREEMAQDDGAMVRDDGAMVRDDGAVVRDDGRATPKNVVRIKGADIGRTDGTDVGRTGAADALSALAEETARERTEAVFAAADAQAAQETAAAEDRAIRSQRQESPFPVQETPIRETAPPSSTAQDRTQEPADALIATLGENGQKAFRAAYQAGGDLPAAFREFSHAYRQGVNGAAETDVAAGRQVNTLSAYYAGQNDAALSLKREKKAARFAQTAGSESGRVYDDFVKEAVESGRTIVTTEGERAVYLSGEAAEQVNQVARRLGLRVRFVDSIDVNGQKDAANAAISGAEVQIQKNNPNPVRFLMGHEMTHRMQELAPKEYRAFRSAAANDLVVQRAVQDQMARHARRGISLSYEAALDEAAADYAGRLVQDGAVLDDFIRQHKENRSLLEKLRDAVRDLIRKLTGKDRAQAQTAEGKLTAALEAAAKRAEKLDAKKNTAQEGGKERFSINEEFRQELREWFEDGQPAGELFTLGSTGPVLQGLGAIESDIYMNGDKISTILEQHPEMSIREIQRIPEMLEDPTLILKSKGTGKDKNNSRMVLYGSIKAQNGQPVLAVLDLRPRESGFLLNDMQKVNSTYTKNNPASFVTGSDVLYADKKRTVPLLRHFGLTITSRQLLRNGSMGSITYDGDRVKMSGVPFSSLVDLVDGERYSLKEDTVSKSYAAILEENELLRERVDYWKGQTKQTRQPTTDKKAVDRAARDLVKAYSADLDTAEIAGELQALYDAMASGKRGGAEYSGEAASRDAGAIARKLVESAIVDDDTLYQDYSDLRQFLKGTKLTISETDAADVLDYNDLRKRNFGRAVISKGPTNVDQVYQELSERWPEFFDEARDTHPADQLQRIDDVLGEVYRIGETNPYAASMEEAVTGAANEILETFFDLPQTRKTFADRQAQKLDAARAKGQAQVQKVRAQRDARLAELREQNRARTAKAVERERTRREEQVARLRSRYEARDAAGRERRSARELRAKIVRHAKALSQKLLRPTDKQHVPEDLRTAVAAMLESINLESAPGARSFTVDPVTKKRIYQPEGTPTKRTEAFLKLKEQYQKIIEDGSSNMVLDPTLFGDAAENIKGSFDQVISMRDIRLADMNMEQLQTVWNVVRAVERSIATAGEAISDSKYTEIAAWANDLDRDTKGRKPKETLTETGLLKSLENPYTFFSHYGESGMAIYRMLRDAQDQQQVMRGQVEEAAAKIVDPKTVEKLEKETKTFELENGDKLTLTTAQVMEIYELMKRKQAYNHLLKGGIVQPKVKSAKIRRGKEAIHLTTGDLGQIAQSLTEEEIRIADGLQRLTNGLLAGYGNEASMKVYGYKKFTEDNYWPIHSSKEGIYARPENSKGNVRAIKNIGLAKTTVPHASNALDIGSIFDTFAAHAGDMIDYAAWLAPMEDAVRLFNFKFRTAEGVDTGRSVKGILDQYGGAGSQEYWSRLMENIQNGISASSKDPLTDFAAKGIGSFKGAAVGGNLRVVLQQPTAILRASAVLNPADMAKGLASGVTKGSGWKKAVKWSPIAQRKAAGGFDISSPVQMKESLFDGRTAVRKLNDLLSSPAGKADAATWGRIWNACEWTVARKRPGLTKGSDDFYRAVNRVFTEVIDQTQVVDGVLQRSNIMRSPSDMAKMATSFMGEPTMALNMFLRAWDQMRYEQDPARRGKAIKNLGRVGTALVVTNLVNAFAQSLVDGIRDDDKEKGYWERVLKAFTGLTGEEENAWEKAVSVGLTGNAAGGLNPLGMVPYLRDVLSLMQGYEVARTDTEVLSALVRAGTTAIKSAGGNGPKTRTYAAKEVAASGAKLFGIPVSNITRDVWSMVRTIAQGTGNLELQYAMERAINNIGYSGNQGKYYTLAFQALQAGNMDLYRQITADLIAQGVKASSIESAMNKRLEDAVKEDPAFALPQEAQDLIGSRTAYAPEEEKEASFGPNDLSPEVYTQYSSQRAETYRAWADELEGNRRFQRLDDTTKDKVLTAAADLAEDLALRDHSGGKYQNEDLSTWERWAAGGEGWGVDPVEALLFRAAYDMAESEIKDGETVSGSKKENALELAEDLLPRLSDREMEYLMAYYWSPEDKKLDKLKENKFLA